jgi:hypothetical protein
MYERLILVAFLFCCLAAVGVWGLCMAIKQDILEADRDRLDYDPGCDPVSLRNAGRQGRDA